MCVRLQVMLLVLLVSPSAMSAEEQPVRPAIVEASYPCWRNDGSGAGPDCGAPLVERLVDAKLVWESEEKGLYSSYNAIMGGAAGPVVAGERIYVNYCVPSGEVLAESYYQGLLNGKTPEEVIAGRKQRGRGGYDLIQTPEDIRRRCLIGADDVTLCLDAATGTTVWKAVFPDAGMNPSMQVRGFSFNKMGPHCLPAVAYGKVVTIGSIGLVQCVEATDGKRCWEFKTKHYEANLATKQKLIATKAMAKWNDPRCSPTFAAGRFIIRDGARLIALEPETGKPAWELNVGGIPVRWVHGGQEYLISHTSCIDPKTGKILWTADGAIHGGRAVTVADDMLLFSGDKNVGLQGYRISPEKAEKVWATDPQLCISDGEDTPVILHGHAYVSVKCVDLGGASFACIEMATGKVINRIRHHNDSCGSLVGSDDHAFFDGLWLKADPKDFRIDDSTSQPADKKLWGGSNSDYCRAASSTPAIANGRLYIRGQRSIFCFDLRK